MNIQKYLNTAINNPTTSLFTAIHQLRRHFPLDYWWGSGYSFYPDLITILITERCNFFCERCSSDSPRITKLKKIKELKTREIKNFIDEIAWFRPALYFCGGEPTLRADLFELLTYAKSKKLITAFTTNGSLLNKDRIKKIFTSKVDFLSISIDGPEKEHDKGRGFPGAYRKATAALKELIKYRQRHQLNYPHIKIAAVLDAFKIDNSYFVLDLANQLKVDEISFGMLMFYTPEAEKKQKDLIKSKGIGGEYMIGLRVSNNYKFKVNLDQVKKFYREAPKKSQVPVFYYAPEEKYFDHYFKTEIYPSADSQCTKPWFSALVKSNGDISICQGLVAGNIKENRFLKRWNDEKFKKFRAYRKKHIIPACFRCSEGQKIKF